MLVKLVVGDWSRAGHEKTEDFIIETPGTPQGVEELYKKMCEKTGLEKMVSEYEDRTITEDAIYEIGQKLEAEDAVMAYVSTYVDSDEEDKLYDFYPDTYAQFCCFLMKLVDENFQYEFVDISQIHIGGYGLFLY